MPWNNQSGGGGGNNGGPWGQAPRNRGGGAVQISAPFAPLDPKADAFAAPPVQIGDNPLAVSFGVELAAEGATSSRFETRRFARGAGIVLLLVAALAGLSRLGFLFPDTQRNQVVPPKRWTPLSPE